MNEIQILEHMAVSVRSTIVTAQEQVRSCLQCECSAIFFSLSTLADSFVLSVNFFPDGNMKYMNSCTHSHFHQLPNCRSYCTAMAMLLLFLKVNVIFFVYLPSPIDLCLP